MIALLGCPPRYTAVGLVLIMLAVLVLAGRRPRTRSDAPQGVAHRSTTEPTDRVAE